MSASYQKQEFNPVGLNGVSFIEFTANRPDDLAQLFTNYGFKKIAMVKGREISLYRQGSILFLLNCEPNTFAANFSKHHGPSICSTGWRVKNASEAFKTSVARGAKPFLGTDKERGATPFPAVYGIGNSLIYFLDEKFEDELITKQFLTSLSDVKGEGLLEIDHFTNNVPKGEMDKWSNFYTEVFNFKEIRYFDIKGKSTGLVSRAMASPCGRFAVPINEPSDSKSQIQEYLDEYKGSGIQHVALSTNNILSTLNGLRGHGLDFLSPPPATYYKMLKDRLPRVSEDIKELQSQAVLVDGDDHGYLLQIFSKNIVGPIFFEIIQRKNHKGFGEGNFQALFDSIEADQRERGYLK